MPNIQAFRGLRYDLGHVGSLGDVVAPPYDVIDSAMQDELYERHPANVIRLILNRQEPGDDGDENRYSRAARFLKNWRNEGAIQEDPKPAMYVYHQVFNDGQQKVTRRGFMCRVRLQPFGEGNIYPHEQTHASAKADRLKLTQACKTNLSQIFGIYPDPESEVQNLLEEAIIGVTPLEATDHLGVLHRLWPMTDLNVISKVTAVMDPKPTYVADGHHRYETACNYRDTLAADGPLPPNHPANFVLMMCIGMNDPGMIVLPTHRLLHGLEEMTSQELIEKLGDCFTCNQASQGHENAKELWKEIENEDDQGTLGLFTTKDQQWMKVQITDQGRQKMATVASEQSEDWRGLGVSILHRLIIETLLGTSDLPKPTYVHLVSEVVSALTKKDVPEGEKISLAAMVMPATLEHIRAISEHGERMPAKSTYFYPKLLSGLVFNPLE